MVVCSKNLQVLEKSMIFRAFHGMSSFLQLLAAMFIEMPKHCSLFERLQVLAKSMSFRAFSRNEALSAEKFIKRQRHGSLFQKLQSSDQIHDFSCFFTK